MTEPIVPAPPSPTVLLEQVGGYQFRVSFPGTRLAPSLVDEGAPLGTGEGPDPVQVLAAAVGHCLSSTLVNTLERARVPSTRVRTRVGVEIGRNARGRKRVLALNVQIECAPIHAEDRERFALSTSVFEDYCTVTGAVREGIRVSTAVRPASAEAPPEPAHL